MQNSLFDNIVDGFKQTNAPLADRLRSTSLDDFYGQRHIVGKGKLLYRMITADKLSSIIFSGPAGSGKTSLAKIIASTTKSEFLSLNAVTSGVKDIKEVIEQAKNNVGMYEKRTILFIDEIHRFNKSQQDALLPSVEDGTIILIGATTENPSFEINSALVSRSTVFMLEPLKDSDIIDIINRALSDKQKGLGLFPIEMSVEAKEHFAKIASGDARIALNALELAYLTTPKNSNGKIVIDLDVAEDCIQTKVIKYDKKGDNHYDTISAFIKSIRGSDPNAGIHYLAKMLYAGEDPKFIARRLVILASEDIGNADPFALTMAVSTQRAVEILGMPECRINLAQAVIYLALSPKSNSAYNAINQALEDVKNLSQTSVPLWLRSSNNHPGYKYAHSYENHYVEQEYMPKELKGTRYYINDNQGAEKRLNDKFKAITGKDNNGDWAFFS